MDWTHSGPAILASFFGSFVEFVEALTIVLAVGINRGWRPAILGTVAAALVLAILVLAFGPSLRLIDIRMLQLVVGILLLLFGMRWLRKAILRAAGILKLHNETQIFASETAALQVTSVAAAAAGFDTLGFVTSFNAVFIEGIEVVFIVIAVGAAANMLLPASVGALLAGSLVVLLGLILQKPMARVPENTLKFLVGVLLSAFGVFWIGEGLRFPWLGGDWAILILAAGFLVGSSAAVQISKSQARLSGGTGMQSFGGVQK